MQKHNGTPTDLILSRLANVRKIGGGWMASCPAHGGHDCLSVSEKEGRTLVHCFAGCDTGEVMHSIDLRMADLFVDSLNPARKRDYEIRSATAARDHSKMIIAIAAGQVEKGGELTDEDLSQMAAAQARIDEANNTLAALNHVEPEEPEEANPLLRHLSYDSDAALDRIASQQWLIDQVLPVDGFGVIYGPSGSYKSFVAIDLAACVASAQPWHGADTDNPGHVIYIGAEGALGLHLRKKAWEIRYQKPLKNLAILGTAVTLNAVMEREQLIELCLMAAAERNEPIKLIVIDTLARSFDGEENSASDMGAFVRACDRIRAETGATVLVIHHSGKDADRGARGSSALRAACDFEFKVVSPGKKVTRLTCTKAKDSDSFEDIDFKLEVVEIGRNDAKGRAMGSLVLKKTVGGSTGGVDDLTGHPQTLNNLVALNMSSSGQDFVMKEFLRDSFYHAIGRQDRKAFTRSLEKLVDDGWVAMDSNGKIERNEVF
jgi:RecA/RadA recombinase